MRPRDFQLLFTYDSWANRQALDSLRPGGEAAGRPLKLLAHIGATKHLWLGRILYESPRMAVWPELDLHGCERTLAEADARWDSYLQALTADQLPRMIAYRNSKGESWTSRVEHILIHVVLHSAHHRGQIAAQVRAAGREPACTDFIHAVRTNSLQVEEVSRE